MSPVVNPDSGHSPASPVRLAVIGGGITGLAAALRLWDLSNVAAATGQPPPQITLFDTAARLGGVFGSERIGEYLIERGADSFITNKPQAVALCQRLGIEDRLIPTASQNRGSLILHRGKTVPTPRGFNLMAPRYLGPMLTTPLLSASGKLRLLAECFVPRGPAEGDESVAAFVRRRLGAEVLDNIVQPLVGGIYTSNPEQLSLRATLPRFLEMEQRHGSLIRAMRANSASEGEESASGARYGLFASFQDGMSELQQALQRELTGKVELRTSQAVTSLKLMPGESGRTSWQLTFGDGRNESYDGVLVTTSHLAAAELLRDVDPTCAATLSQIEAASSAIVVTGHSLLDITHPLDAFGLVIPHRERRRVLAVSFLSRKFPSRAPAGKVILRTFIGGAMQPEEFNRSDEELIATVLRELEEILGVRGKPEFAVVARYPKGMPQYTLGHLDRVARIIERIAEIPQLELAGNAYTGVGLPDCIHSGQQAAERLWMSMQMR